MKRTLIPMALVLASPLAFAQQGTWLGDDGSDIDLSLHLGVFGDGIKAYAINGSMPVYKGNRIGLDMSQLQAEPESITSTNFYAMTDPFARFTFGLAFSSSSQETVFDSTDFELSAGWNFGSWYLEGQFLSGEIVLEAQDPRLADAEPEEELPEEEIPEGEEAPVSEAVIDAIQQILKNAGYLDVSRQGFGLALSYFSDNYALRFGFTDYAADEDRDTSDVTLREVFAELDAEERQALIQALRNTEQRQEIARAFRIANYATTRLAKQAGHLVSNEFRVDYVRQLSDLDVGLGYSIAEQLFIDETVSTMYVSADYPVDEDTDFGFILSTSDHDSALYAEVNMSFSW